MIITTQLTYLRGLAQIPASGRRKEFDCVYLEVIGDRVVMFATDGVAIIWFRPPDATIKNGRNDFRSGIPCAAIGEIVKMSEAAEDFFDLEAKIEFDDGFGEAAISAGGYQVTARQPESVPEWRQMVKNCGPEESTGRLCVDAAFVGRIGQALDLILGETKLALVPTAASNGRAGPIQVLAPGEPNFGGLLMPWESWDPLSFPQWIGEVAQPIGAVVSAAKLDLTAQARSRNRRNEKRRKIPASSRRSGLNSRKSAGRGVSKDDAPAEADDKQQNRDQAS